MKNISTGTGLCVLGLCLASYPIIDRVMPRAEAGATNVATAVAAGTAQVPPEPTIVWYSAMSELQSFNGQIGIWMCSQVWRGWSDGRIEVKHLRRKFTDVLTQYTSVDTWCTDEPYCSTGWVVIDTPNSGYNAASDINFDSKVDGADLSQVLNDWGNAPRQDIVPSTCPLNLINP
jgi:hypothetical protein